MKRRSYKNICALLAICFLFSCGSCRSQVDRVVEGGVEVVLNHVQPYRIPGELPVLSLEMEFVIDSEDPGLLKAGLADIRQFGADSHGYIYILQRPRKDTPFIFKFDTEGRLQRLFGRFGQGPGEIERSSYFSINSRDEIFCLDAQGRKILSYSSSGEILKEIDLRTAPFGAIPLDSGGFLYTEDEITPDEGFENMTFSLLDRDFAKTKIMHSFRFPASLPGAGKKVNAFLPNPTGIFTADRIFLGIPGPDYEIFAFDLDGTLLRKIRKEYAPVEVTSGYRKRALANLPNESRVADQLEFPNHKPAYVYFFGDEFGRLFVMTSEQDETSGQNVCDIFNASGIFIGRVAVGYYDRFRHYWEGVSLDVVAKNSRFYVLREKEDGYKELVVYKAVWR